MIMKLIKKALLFAIAFALVTPIAASAKTTVTGGPFANLPATGGVVTLKLSGYPTNAGFYILQCLSEHDDSRPQICNPNNQLWISTSPGANFAPTADIQFRPTATFTFRDTGVDCTKAKCEIFIRLDHMATGNKSEDLYLPLAFVGGSTPSSTADIITAHINNRTIKGNANIGVRYKDVFTIVASAKSGATLTFSTTSTTCSLTGNQVTILKGFGICDIAISSPGNGQYSANTVHYLFNIKPGLQRITVTTSVRAGTNLTLPTLSNFGETVSYEKSTTGNCTLTGNVVYFNKTGACMIKATALAKTDTYTSLNQTLSFKIR